MNVEFTSFDSLPGHSEEVSTMALQHDSTVRLTTGQAFVDKVCFDCNLSSIDYLM